MTLRPTFLFLDPSLTCLNIELTHNSHCPAVRQNILETNCFSFLCKNYQWLLIICQEKKKNLTLDPTN